MLCDVGHLLLLRQHLNLHLLLLRQLHEVVKNVFFWASFIGAPFVHIFSRTAHAIIVKVLPVPAILLRTQVGKISISGERIRGTEVVI